MLLFCALPTSGLPTTDTVKRQSKTNRPATMSGRFPDRDSQSQNQNLFLIRQRRTIAQVPPMLGCDSRHWKLYALNGTNLLQNMALIRPFVCYPCLLVATRQHLSSRASASLSTQGSASVKNKPIRFIWTIPLPTSLDLVTARFVIDGFCTAMFVNHSCNGNAETVEEDGRVWITAIRDIEPDGEITYDYCLYDGGDDPCTCNCGAESCRGSMYSPDELKRRKDRGSEGRSAQEAWREEGHQNAQEASEALGPRFDCGLISSTLFDRAGVLRSRFSTVRTRQKPRVNLRRKRYNRLGRVERMGYQVLARKYRPQRFADVAGQDHVTRTLVNALTQKRIAHGYIFSGHRGIGKTTIARILAMALDCRTEVGES